jgi:hypothetical protein
MTFRSLLFLSLMIGIGAFAAGRGAIELTIEIPVTLAALTLAFLVPWAVLQAVGIWKYRWRGLWLLVGLPLILLLPFLMFWVEWSCQHGNLDACI